MAECTHLEQTSAYFDGALPAGEEAAALAHLETCAECQAFLRDAAVLDAVLSQAPVRTQAPPRRRR
ncbi:MAG TPA: zf-HC2 domain-containing protein [Kofleriaceae bacterium]|nr:zf-HC2 domain-containing protein [Kofleriaceae bacterium]